MPVDASGELYDGSPLDGPVALRKALLKRQEIVLRTFTENLMAYALGRRVEHFDMPAVRTIVREAALSAEQVLVVRPRRREVPGVSDEPCTKTTRRHD